MSEEKKEIPKIEDKVYQISGSLPFMIEFQNTENGLRWKCSYETSLERQLAVFGYVADMYLKIIENCERRNKEWLDEHKNLAIVEPGRKKYKVKLPHTHTYINEQIKFRNHILHFIDEMLPIIYKEVKEEEDNKTKLEIVEKMPSNLKLEKP